ncbi:MAG: putative DNA binding domain-containing protein [Bacteroidota bacterium]|nr:putative DNA binding domain-containing protein [Bacteroidota bacterium]
MQTEISGNITDEEIRQRLVIGEDHRWEFKQIKFKGDQPESPRREDLADEIIAFANANGRVLLCGVSDDGQLQGLSTKKLSALNQVLSDVCSDSIEPPIRVRIYHRVLDGKAYLLVEVPQGDSAHERSGRAFIRVGGSKRQLSGDEKPRLSQSRSKSRYLRFDQQIVPETGFGSLNERLWEPLLSAEGQSDPTRALMNSGLLAVDETDAYRATVAGILLCTDSPQQWFPHAMIMATMYRGKDRASGQLDAQEIKGPLSQQIFDAVNFVVRNMRVAAQKTPAREDLPEYSKVAVFEAIVNAVIHRDYSIYSSRIRLSMFKDRLEIDSPGQLPNGMTIEMMNSLQSTRNETLASVFGRLSVSSIPGSEHRRYMMEKRGDGVSLIIKSTRETAGIEPKYTLIDESNLVLTIPAARFELTPAEATITIHSVSEPILGVDVLALFPNKTWKRVSTDVAGEAEFDLHSTHLPMTIFAAAPGYSAGLASEWVPRHGGLLIELAPLTTGGSVIFPDSTGRIPGLYGRLNPIRDGHDRTYLYAQNIAIEGGRQQPVPFRFGKPMRLMDSYGVEMSVTILSIIGRAVLIEYTNIDQFHEG